jgi:hypothetical protein
MTRIEINLQTAANHGYLFAIVGRAAYLGAGSNVEYIGPGNCGDLRIMPTVPSK